MIEDVKLVLGITDNSLDSLLTLMCEDAKAAITDYCNRKDFPMQLAYLAREIVVDSYKVNTEGSVSSVTRGDTQISYSNVINKDNFTDKQIKAMSKYKLIKMV